METDPRKVDFMGLPLLALDTQSFIQWMMALAKRNNQVAQVTYLNAWCTNVAFRDNDYKELIKRWDGAYADGQAVVWGSKCLGSPIPERVNAGDFIIPFLQEAEQRGCRIFLLGSEAGVAQKAAKHFRATVPGVQIIGAESGYFPDGEAATIRRIAEAAPDFLLIGMGVPRQEKWAETHRDQLNTKVIWCVGALFEYYSDHRARAPKWMIRAGLEWLFRLVLEPRRLWRRYLLGNIEFVWRVLRWKRSRSG